VSATRPRPCWCTRTSPQHFSRRSKPPSPRSNYALTKPPDGYSRTRRRANEEDYEREFLDLILAVKVVASLDEAIAHVARYGTGHSEAILTSDANERDAWVRRVDAAAVLVNASTRFIDGGELGLGGEVGISTRSCTPVARWD